MVVWTFTFDLTKTKETRMFITSRFSNRHLEIICESDLLFIHAFTGCDTTSRIFGVGKQFIFQKFAHNHLILRNCSEIFCIPNVDQITVEGTGCKGMVCLFNGGQYESLGSLRYKFLCKKVATASTFVKPERLPPTTSATKFHARRTYLQVMEWMGMDDGNIKKCFNPLFDKHVCTNASFLTERIKKLVK